MSVQFVPPSVLCCHWNEVPAVDVADENVAGNPLHTLADKGCVVIVGGVPGTTAKLMVAVCVVVPAVPVTVIL